MGVTMLPRLNLARTDYLRQAEELSHFAHSIQIDPKGKQFGKDFVKVVNPERRKAKKCFECKKTGHVKAGYPKKREIN
ncbi:unnamed protein product [Albugo candida]|uniref:CCHC-type domain-containing protein n=1 Tax=Albugo candida TaxID=65357 RepID=A0A024FV96_9STRA|nr:unnamed protein product [Albugo candida]|eukprot:CCI11078.1 unnamed protein product [Albugo candida]